jgi:hypothetical protein
MRTVQLISLVSLLGLSLAILPACKKGGEGGAAGASSGSTGAAPAKGPLLTKPFDQVTKDDLSAAITGLGWKPGQSSNSSSGPKSNIMVTGKKDGDTRQLVVAVYKMPADALAEWKTHNTELAIEVQGSTVLGVKYYPADQAEATKTVARLMGK